MTLNEFYQATEGRELSVVAANTTAGKMMVLNHTTAPDLPVVWAVRMSMSIPMVWPEVVWQADWGTYMNKPPESIVGNRLVDGGLLSNFPIELMICEEAYATQLMGPKAANRVIGMLIDESKDVDGAPPPANAKDESGFDLGQLQLAQRLNRLVNTATGAHDKMVIEAYDQMVVRLPAKGYGTTEFDMSEERRAALIRAGERAMRSYLDFRDQASFGLSFSAEPASSYEVSLAGHADKVTTQIFDW